MLSNNFCMGHFAPKSIFSKKYPILLAFSPTQCKQGPSLSRGKKHEQLIDGYGGCEDLVWLGDASVRVCNNVDRSLDYTEV